MKLMMVLVSFFVLAGCSTITKGKTQQVTIDSNVEGATVLVNGNEREQTPFTGLIERSSSTTVTLKKKGYKRKSVTLDTTFEPIFWGNIIVGGVIGSTTDASTGAMYKYAPSTINIDLIKEGN